ncbi:PAS domain S-box protein [Alkalihalobacillus sp. MEB130]|uniref:PAS domain S-box protein n=1 Tax=Alkalihalobacillus sp. MEB130 TaxID=2976704 RepID=UPI0028DE6A90|nr:PAS domain S-box protein [Alkalihalobacillus sp. MEB130]MDT8860266.1 PAS domain S-box protein [Alkalihalobacillus sp. MEB130]
MIDDLILNITIIISFLYLLGLFSRLFYKKTLDLENITVITKIGAGVCFGILGLVLMMFSIQVSPTVIVDLRHIATVIAATFFGAPAAIVSAVMIGVSRLFFGINIASISAMIMMFFIGIACSLMVKVKIKQVGMALVMNLVSIVFIYVVLYINLMVFSNNRNALLEIYSFHGILSIFGGLLAFYVCKYIVDFNKLHSDLTRINGELEQSNQRFKAFIESLNSGIIVESDKREVTFVNGKFHEMFGISKSSNLINMDCNKLVDRSKDIFENKGMFKKRIDELLECKEIVTEEQLSLIDGRVVERDYIPIQSNNGTYLGNLWNYRDITERKAFEIQIINRQKKYRELLKQNQLVLESTQEVIFTTDQKGNWTFLNKAWSQITGFSVKESLGKNLSEYIHIEDIDKNEKWFFSLLKKEKEYCRHEIRFLTKEGSVIWLEVLAKLFIDNEGGIIGTSGSLTDISHRKGMEEKLLESEQKYKSLFENNASLTYTIDLQGHFISVNHAAEKITGYTNKDLEGSAFIPIISKPYVKHTIEQYEKALNGESVNYETQIIHRNGNKVFLNVNVNPLIIDGKISGVIGMAYDITSQKKAEQKLFQSEQRYRSLIDLSPEVIFVHSKTKIEYINDKVVSFLGISNKEDMIGKSVFDIIHPEDKYTVAYNMTLGFYNSPEFPEFSELRFMKQDGGVVVAHVRAKMIEYEEKPAMLGIIHDVTAQKELELQLIKANEMLKKTSNLDGLTGIPNRRYYDETIAREWLDAMRQGKVMSVIMIDIDCFKLYNDTYGHQQGDICLKKVARTLKAILNRPKDFVARYGGEEFSVILPDTDEKGAAYLAEKLRSSIEQLNLPHIHSTVKPMVTISLGISSVIPVLGSSYKELIESADKALYKAKKNGRNQVNM